jgi:hypothetical protein
VATYFIQIKRLFSLLVATVPMGLAGCIATQPFPQGISVAPPTPLPAVRAPHLGQEWVYEVHNVFNQDLVDVVTERVVEVGSQVRIARTGEKSGPLPDEIQSPWGFVLQDPHWSPPQKFQQAIPIWPTQFQLGLNQFYKSQYQVLGNPDGNYYWGLDMTVLAWEKIQVPAGEFLTLRYHNEVPYFESNDLFRVKNMRDEDVWFSPEIGRWVIRRGYGRYITPGVFWSNAYWEDYWEWVLVSWK